MRKVYFWHFDLGFSNEAHPLTYQRMYNNTTRYEITNFCGVLMKREEWPQPVRKENYLVNASLILKDKVIKDIPCKIYLPERPHEKPYIIFKPSKADAIKLTGAFKAALKANVYDLGNELQETIETPEVYLSGCKTTNWGGGISEATLSGKPQDLHVIKHFNNPEGSEQTHMVFWISPNILLTPYTICSSSNTGDIKYKKVRTPEFSISNGIKLSFENYFRTNRTDNGDLVQWSHLVACTELNVPADDIETLKNQVLPVLDDFLLISSFAIRKRTACLGWTASDKHSHATYYRGNYSFPDNEVKQDINDCVVDISDFPKFMKASYSAFLKYENKLALRNALYSAVPSKPHPIEVSFLQLFAGLEMLILDFRRQENLEFILPAPEWTALRNHLQRSIKASTEPKLNSQQRASIYSKLGELNRVSLREAFDVFCQRFKIDLSDLWPVFKANGFVGLTDIRNKLIHGDPFPENLNGALIVARESLECTLERMLVKILGWDVEKTRVNQSYVRMYYLAGKDLPIEQAKLTAYISSQNQSEN